MIRIEFLHKSKIKRDPNTEEYLEYEADITYNEVFDLEISGEKLTGLDYFVNEARTVEFSYPKIEKYSFLYNTVFNPVNTQGNKSDYCVRIFRDNKEVFFGIIEFPMKYDVLENKLNFQCYDFLKLCADTWDKEIPIQYTTDDFTFVKVPITDPNPINMDFEDGLGNILRNVILIKFGSTGNQFGVYDTIYFKDTQWYASCIVRKEGVERNGESYDILVEYEEQATDPVYITGLKDLTSFTLVGCNATLGIKEWYQNMFIEAIEDFWGSYRHYDGAVFDYYSGFNFRIEPVFSAGSLEYNKTKIHNINFNLAIPPDSSWTPVGYLSDAKVSYYNGTPAVHLFKVGYDFSNIQETSITVSTRLYHEIWIIENKAFVKKAEITNNIYKIRTISDGGDANLAGDGIVALIRESALEAGVTLNYSSLLSDIVWNIVRMETSPGSYVIQSHSYSATRFEDTYRSFANGQDRYWIQVPNWDIHTDPDHSGLTALPYIPQNTLNLALYFTGEAGFNTLQFNNCRMSYKDVNQKFLYLNDYTLIQQEEGIILKSKMTYNNKDAVLLQACHLESLNYDMQLKEEVELDIYSNMAGAGNSVDTTQLDIFSLKKYTEDYYNHLFKNSIILLKLQLRSIPYLLDSLKLNDRIVIENDVIQDATYIINSIGKTENNASYAIEAWMINKSIIVEYPNQADLWFACGDTITILWKTTIVSNIDIILVEETAIPVKYTTLGEDIENDGSYDWTIATPSPFDPEAHYKILIRRHDQEQVNDMSDNYFRLTP